ncbi:MAG: hypothetical protein ACD_75C02067G0001, partial [uncultured bacterium]
MDRPAAVLTEKYLVDIGREDLVFGVVVFEQESHDRLLDLARQVPFAVEEQVLDQLLGQGAAALDGLARTDIGRERPENAKRGDTVMGVEIPVLDGEERPHQQFGDFLPGEQDPVFMDQRMKAADPRRIELGKGKTAAVLEG